MKGGRLAAACAPARVVTLVVSDVVGDDLSVIASGPTFPDPSSFTEAIVVLDRHGIRAPEVRRHLYQGAMGHLEETPKPRDPVFLNVEHHLVVTNAAALAAAVASLEGGGVHARVLSDAVEGPARRAAREHARLARALPPPAGLVSGGETTTVVPPRAGRGGRNVEFALALALDLAGEPGVYALACDSDGVDGTSGAAGALVTPDTLERAARLGLDAREYLERGDAGGFFERLGDLVVTGPTGTNVNDVRIVLRV